MLLVLLEICYELLLNYDYLKQGFKESATIMEKGAPAFWRRMRDNFLLILMFTPSLITFYFMREVAKENVTRNKVNKGDVNAEF